MWRYVTAMAGIQYGLWALAAILLTLLWARRIRAHLTSVAAVALAIILVSHQMSLLPTTSLSLEDAVDMVANHVHVIAVSAWIGGVGSLVALAGARNQLSARAGVLWAQLWSRFGTVASKPDMPQKIYTGRYESTKASGDRYFWAINQAGNTVIAILTLRGFSTRDGGRASRGYQELRGDIQADGTAVLFRSDEPETFWGYLQHAEKPGRLRWHYGSYLGADRKRVAIKAESERDEVLVWQSADNRPTLMESLYKSDDNYLSVLL
jgi:hypothetical protein